MMRRALLGVCRSGECAAQMKPLVVGDDRRRRRTMMGVVSDLAAELHECDGPGA